MNGWSHYSGVALVLRFSDSRIRAGFALGIPVGFEAALVPLLDLR